MTHGLQGVSSHAPWRYTFTYHRLQRIQEVLSPSYGAMTPTLRKKARRYLLRKPIPGAAKQSHPHFKP